jgi:hypothetical protein
VSAALYIGLEDFQDDVLRYVTYRVVQALKGREPRAPGLVAQRHVGGVPTTALSIPLGDSIVEGQGEAFLYTSAALPRTDQSPSDDSTKRRGPLLVSLLRALSAQALSGRATKEDRQRDERKAPLR